MIRLRETDATGVLYFSEQLNLALEVFESYLHEKAFTLQKMIEEGEFLLPIVHVEADYMAPLRAGDRVVLKLYVEKMGTTSFTVKTIFYLEDVQVGKTSIVHVVTSPKTKKAISIPPQVLTALQGI